MISYICIEFRLNRNLNLLYVRKPLLFNIFFGALVPSLWERAQKQGYGPLRRKMEKPTPPPHASPKDSHFFRRIGCSFRLNAQFACRHSAREKLILNSGSARIFQTETQNLVVVGPTKKVYLIREFRCPSLAALQPGLCRPDAGNSILHTSSPIPAPGGCVSLLARQVWKDPLSVADFSSSWSPVSTALKLAVKQKKQKHMSTQAVCLVPSALVFGSEVGLACVPAASLVAASSVSQDLGLIPVSRLTWSWLVPVSNSVYP